MNSMREELGKAFARAHALAQQELASLRSFAAAYEELSERHAAALELLGEKEEQLDAARAERVAAAVAELRAAWDAYVLERSDRTRRPPPTGDEVSTLAFLAMAHAESGDPLQAQNRFDAAERRAQRADPPLSSDVAGVLAEARARVGGGS